MHEGPVISTIILQIFPAPASKARHVLKLRYLICIIKINVHHFDPKFPRKISVNPQKLEVATGSIENRGR